MYEGKKIGFSFTKGARKVFPLKFSEKKKPVCSIIAEKENQAKYKINRTFKIVAVVFFKHE